MSRAGMNVRDVALMSPLVRDDLLARRQPLDPQDLARRRRRHRRARLGVDAGRAPRDRGPRIEPPTPAAEHPGRAAAAGVRGGADLSRQTGRRGTEPRLHLEVLLLEELRELLEDDDLVLLPLVLLPVHRGLAVVEVDPRALREDRLVLGARGELDVGARGAVRARAQLVARPVDLARLVDDVVQVLRAPAQDQPAEVGVVDPGQRERDRRHGLAAARRAAVQGLLAGRVDELPLRPLVRRPHRDSLAGRSHGLGAREERAHEGALGRLGRGRELRELGEGEAHRGLRASSQ